LHHEHVDMCAKRKRDRREAPSQHLCLYTQFYPRHRRCTGDCLQLFTWRRGGHAEPPWAWRMWSRSPV